MAFGSKLVLSVLYFIANVENHIFCVGIFIKFVSKKRIKRNKVSPIYKLPAIIHHVTKETYMKIKNSELKIPIILNLIIVFFLYFDFLLPSNKIIKEEFMSFYNTVTNVPRIKGAGGREIRNILECKSGNLYYLVSMPSYENNVKVEDEIYVKETILLSKVKSLKVSEKQEWNVSLLSDYWIKFLFVVSILITLINFYFTNKYLDVLLSFSCGYVFVVTASYLFYFS